MPLFLDVDYRLVNTPEKFAELLQAYDKAKLVSFDIETTGLDVTQDYIVGISFTFKEKTGWYIPLNHDLGTNLDYEETLAALKPYLESDKFVNLAHGMKFESAYMAATALTEEYIREHPHYATDLWLTAYGNAYQQYVTQPITQFFDKLGISVKITFDSMTCAYLTGKYAKIGAGGVTWSTAALKKIARTELNTEAVAFEELFGIDPSKPTGRKDKKKQAERLRFNTLDPEQVLEIKSLQKLITVYEYPCQDTDLTFRLFARLYPKVKDMFLFKVDHGCVPITKLMELNGVRANQPRMQAEHSRMLAEYEKCKEIVYRDVSEALGFQVRFDVGSPEQCGDVLFDKLKYPVQARSDKTQKPLTNATVLENMKKDYPIVHNILTARSIRKNADDFLLAMQDYINPLDGRIHCSYATNHVSSGRYACEDPNMQNQPKLTVWKIYDRLLPEGSPVDKNGVPYYEIKSIVRANYIPPDDDYYCLEPDYSQVEYRVMAGRAKVKKWLKGYEDGVDFHVVNATSIFEVSASEVTPEMRRETKTFSFGIGYGMRAGGVAMRIGGTKEQAQVKVDRYFAGAPELLPHIQMITDNAVRKGYVVTEFGRVVWIPELRVQVVDRRSRAIFAKGKREAFNITIQGTAADILRIALTRLPSRLTQHFGIRFNDTVKPVLTTHDSIAFFVHRSVQPEDVMPAIREAMCFPMKGFPEIAVDFKVGPNYGQLIDWEKMKPLWNSEVKDFGFGAYASKQGEIPATAESDEDETESETEDEIPIDGDGPARKQSPMQRLESEDDLVEKPPARFRLVSRDGLTQQQCSQLRDLLLKYPGKNVIMLQTPDTELTMGLQTSLDKAQEGLFKMLFPCDLLPQTGSVNVSSMMKGIKV